MIDKIMFVTAVVILLGVLSLMLWDIFFLTPEIQKQNDDVLSFCINHNFTSYEYTDEYTLFRNAGFCYKEVDGYIEKQDFFVDKNNKVLLVNE